MWRIKVDHKATIDATKQLLGQYGTIKRLALINRSHPLNEQAKQELECIQTTAKLLSDPYQSIIERCYLHEYPNFNEVIASELGYGRTQFYKLKEQSLMMFAECYSNQELLKTK